VKRLAMLSVLAASLLSFGACTTDSGTGDDGDDDGGDSSLTIDNQSSYAFAEIYLSPEDSGAWGEDLLGSDVLAPGETLELSNIDCDVYDIRIVDDEGDDCVVSSVDLCLDNAVWHVDDSELAACQF